VRYFQLDLSFGFWNTLRNEASLVVQAFAFMVLTKAMKAISMEDYLIRIFSANLMMYLAVSTPFFFF